jgi:hypothetical protein
LPHRPKGPLCGPHWAASAATTDAQSSSTNSVNWQCTGTAYDYYINFDLTTQTISDSVTTSLDSFTLNDTHSISGWYDMGWSTSLGSFNAQDSNADSATFAAQGTKSSAGDNYGFSAQDNQSDLAVLTESITGSYILSATNIETQLATSFGSEWLSGSAQSYSFQQTMTSSDVMTDGGTSTYYIVQNGVTQTLTQPFAETESTSQSVAYVFTGPPLSRATLGSFYNHAISGSTPSGIPVESIVESSTNQGLPQAETVAGNAGTSNPNTAEHLGTSPNGLDSSKGLLSAMGGMAAHPLQFTGGKLGGW